ncbi:MAG: hypothetical protein ACFFBZ_12340 [Promethearchaeota archaeon]
MRFCPYCDNILIPKHKILYCKVCEKNFKYDFKSDEYTIVQVIKHDNDESTIIVKEGIKQDKISLEDREAYEDFFQTT